MRTLEKRFQLDGDLESMLTVRQEQARFQKFRIPPAEALVEKPQALRDLQANAVQAPEKTELAYHKQVQELTVTHLSTLAGLKQTLTQQNRIDQALAVDKEMDLLILRPEVLNARIALQLAEPASAARWTMQETKTAPQLAALKAPVTPVTSHAGTIPPTAKPTPDLTPKVINYKYDDQTAKGIFSVDMTGKGMETRDWVVKNIGKIASSKELLLEAGSEPTVGGRYRVLNESLANDILTIEFEVLH